MSATTARTEKTRLKRYLLLLLLLYGGARKPRAMCNGGNTSISGRPKKAIRKAGTNGGQISEK